MFKIKKNDRDLDEVLKQLNMYTMQVALELEAIKNLGTKFDAMNKKLEDLEKRISDDVEEQTSSIPLTLKNRSAIKLIVERYGKITSSQLSKLIKLSRTRCNEYLVEMEKDGILVSKRDGRKKFYSLRR
ncbi:MAG: winged helix-turn-helix transcriptional regulator [Candidatus Aenigmarchaeota archaeon]|nr:winged helix-turn-helix transcriptional regulator [Candidatus Aenigmarchaeota archaeon]